MRVLKAAGVLGVTLACVGVSLGARDHTLGVPVSDHVANELRGGACNQTFFYDNMKVLICLNEEGCKAQIPTSRTVGMGNSGDQQDKCGAEGTCATTMFTAPKDCAE